MASALLLVLATWASIPHWLPIFFAGAIIAGAVLQIRPWRSHRHRRPRDVTDKTLTKIILWPILFGALWGGFTTTLLAVAASKFGILSGIILAGMAAGAAMMLYPIPAAFVAFLLFSVVPIWTLVIAWEGPTPAAILFYTVIYVTFLAVSVRFSYVKFVEGVLLRLENQELAFRAEAASRTTSRFLANMSHELRTPAGGRVRIEGRRVADGGLVIRVADNGIGIAEDELNDVLKPFVQGREAERRHVQATGLGLPLAEQLVRLHGGTLSIAGARGAGTTVSVNFPASRVVPAAALRAAG